MSEENLEMLPSFFSAAQEKLGKSSEVAGGGAKWP